MTRLRQRIVVGNGRCKFIILCIMKLNMIRSKKCVTGELNVKADVKTAGRIHAGKKAASVS